MKKVIIAISVLAAVFACKKKKDDSPAPVPPVVIPVPDSKCQAKTIIERKGNITEKVTITYSGDIPATIKVDSADETKLNLVLDEKGSVKSGTIPISVSGIKAVVDFVSTNTYSNNLLVRAEQTATQIRLPLPVASSEAKIISNYTYDANGDLTKLVRFTNARVTLFFGDPQVIKMRDSILFSGYVNGRPSQAIAFTQDDANGPAFVENYVETYEYDAKGNRVKTTRDGIITEEQTYAAAIYPAKVDYLLNLEGNPNYGNKDQNVNFVQKSKIYKNCSGTPAYDISNVNSFYKTGSCITGVALTDSTANCSGSYTVADKTYQIIY